MNGTTTMVRVQLRTRWKGLTIWTVALVGSLAGTAEAVVPLYDTPAKVASYADAISTGALYAINGHVEGVNSVGGIIQDEFGFMAAFLMPLLGIWLVAGATRKEEEAGRLEMLLSGRVARHAPLVAALIVAAATTLVMVVASAAALTAAGMPAEASTLYAASLGGLTVVFVGVAAVLAQVTSHARGVYGGGFAVLLVAYVLRGIGDSTGTWVTWLSPLGWQEKTAPTGDQRWWVLLIPVALTVVLATVALVTAARRDLGSALVASAAGPGRASTALTTSLGFALRLHRGSFLGWLAGGVVLAGVMGSLAQEVIDAITGNPAMAVAMGAAGGEPVDGFAAMVLVYLALITMGYAIAGVAVLRHEEEAGRLEPRLAGTLSRTRWLLANTLVVTVGLVLIDVASAATFGVTASWSMNDPSQVARLLWAGIAYLPAEALVGAAALALLGTRPRWFSMVWGYYGAAAFVAFLGPGLNLSGWVLDLAPTTHVGNPPMGSVGSTALVVMVAIAVVLGLAAVVGFRRRTIPTH
jgi:ABC-2 type transport system permease protein